MISASSHECWAVESECLRLVARGPYFPGGNRTPNPLEWVSSASVPARPLRASAQLDRLSVSLQGQFELIACGKARSGRAPARPWRSSRASSGISSSESGNVDKIKTKPFFSCLDPLENAMNIRIHRDDPRFHECNTAFLVTGTPQNDALNRELLANNQTGYWTVKQGRIIVGDLIFLLLPDIESVDGYPRELYAGVVVDAEYFEGAGRTLYSVDQFFALPTVHSDVKKFLFGNVPPQGNNALGLWGSTSGSFRIEAPIPPQDEPEEDVFPEGRLKYEQHIRRERKPRLVQIAKRRRMQRDQKLVCEICDFDFLEAYGLHGDGYIEAHHIVPVSTLKENTPTRPEDLALVCANCHRMLHRIDPLLSIEEMRHVVQGAREIIRAA